MADLANFTASQLLAHLYCPRFTYYGTTLGIPEHQELRFKVQKGRQIHADKASANRQYLRKTLGAVSKKQNLYLGAEGHPWRGEVDEVLAFADGSMAPLDYKYAPYRERLYSSYHMQAALYADLIRRIYHVKVEKAFLIFVRSQHKLVSMDMDAAADRQLQSHHRAMSQIVSEGKYPAATKAKKRCEDCCYRNICPK